MSKGRTSKQRAGHRNRPRFSRRARALWFGLAAAVVLGGAVFLASAPFRPPAATSPAASASQQVLVSMAGFEPSRLQARAGQDVALTFVNADSQFHVDGGGWHQFRIEALNIDVRIAPKSQKTVNLGSLPAGNYEFYCDICCGGKENPSMRGVLEVRG